MFEEDKIRLLYQQKNKFQTALQIVGQEERETVLVEALAFFINPYMKNGMTAESLKKFFEAKIGEGLGRFLTLKTEFPVGKNRLDMLIQYENYLIGIEAKINAIIDNPLDKYSKAVEERANDSKHSMLVLVKKSNKNKTSDEIEEKYPDEKIQVITWEEISAVIDPNNSVKNPNIVQDLSKAIKQIDKESEQIFSDSELQGIDASSLDDEAEKLKNALDLPKGWKPWIWGNDKGNRAVIHPRLVVESDGKVIDVIIREKNHYQFIIFERTSYEPELYESVSGNYRFRFWRDYWDTCPLYNRYLLLAEEQVEGKGIRLGFVAGVELPREDPSPEEYSAGDERTFFKFEEHSEVSTYVKKIISNLFR